MNEKLSFQNITETLAQKAGVQKKVSETFTKAFFDTIVEALYMGEDTIKVKGLGTFKLVDVGSRESVNVSNGERIVIPGYKKVSFTPDDSVVEFLNSKTTTDEQTENVEPEPVEEAVKSTEQLPQQKSAETTNEVEDKAKENEDTPPFSSEVEKQEEIERTQEEVEIVQNEVEITVEQSVSEEVTEIDEPTILDDLLKTATPERVEIPQNEFAGIDMLISTPESVEEIRQQLSDATSKMDEAVEVARKAIENKLRLQRLLERLEANSVPESVEPVIIAEEKAETEDTSVSADTTETQSVDTIDESITEPLPPTPPSSSNTDDEEERKNRAFERVMQDPKDNDSKTTTQKKNKSGIAWGISIAIILLAVIIFFLYKTFLSIDSVNVVPLNNSTTPKVEQPKENLTTSTVQKLKEKQVPEATNDTLKTSPKTAEAQQPASPATTDAEPSRPTVYIMKKGESLTRISQRFYGTKDSVRAIIRINDFIDPNNVPIGAKIKLP